MKNISSCIFFIACLTSCSTHKQVKVVSDTPSDCTFIARIASLQCSTGIAGSTTTTIHTIRTLKKEAQKRGGNVLNCCTVAEEELVISGVNEATGQITCIGMKEHIAEIFSCPH